jgi:hypothetical protein
MIGDFNSHASNLQALLEIKYQLVRDLRYEDELLSFQSNLH